LIDDEATVDDVSLQPLHTRRLTAQMS
jgi:hypothetical protein